MWGFLTDCGILFMACLMGWKSRKLISQEAIIFAVVACTILMLFVTRDLIGFYTAVILGTAIIYTNRKKTSSNVPPNVGFLLATLAVIGVLNIVLLPLYLVTYPANSLNLTTLPSQSLSHMVVHLAKKVLIENNRKGETIVSNPRVKQSYPILVISTPEPVEIPVVTTPTPIVAPVIREVDMAQLRFVSPNLEQIELAKQEYQQPHASDTHAERRQSNLPRIHQLPRHPRPLRRATPPTWFNPLQDYLDKAKKFSKYGDMRHTTNPALRQLQSENFEKFKTHTLYQEEIDKNVPLELAHKAIELAHPPASDRETAKRIYFWVARNFRKARIDEQANLFKSWNARSGLCSELSRISTAMYRYAGLTAITVVGICPVTEGGGARVHEPPIGIASWGNHAWNAVYLVDEKKWISMDVTWEDGDGRWFDPPDFFLYHLHGQE